MRWFEYKMEVDDLHSPDELKQKLLSMQTEQTKSAEKAKPNSVSKRRRFGSVVGGLHRRRIAAVAACLAVSFVVGGMVNGDGLDGIGMGSTAGLYSGEPMEEQVTRAAAVQEDAREEALASMSLDNGMPKASDTLSGSGLEQQEGQEQKIIYTAWMSIETKQYDETLEALQEAVKQAGGYIESSGETDYEGQGRSGDITFRIPAAQYQTFLGSVSESGSVRSRNEQAEDITASYTDVQARIDTLEQTRSRLLELEAKAESVSELVEIENSLSDIQYRLESSQRQKNYYDRAVSYCTVSVTVREVKEYTDRSESLGERLVHALRNGWKTFVGASERVLVGLFFLSPVLAVVGICVILFRFFRRKKNKKQQN